MIRGKHPWGFKKTLKPTDKRLRNIRGFTFMNSSFSSKTARLKKHILDRGCKAVLVEEEYAGVPAYYLHIDHDDSDDPITDEDVWFEKETYLGKISRRAYRPDFIEIVDVDYKRPAETETRKADLIMSRQLGTVRHQGK
ncbi:MAG: hypothetical protein ISS26_01055 [Candidatus Omnitrophica bacterium]|nr:hypothetical protein [Candidatus Omnitrophota bacterium]